VVEVSAHKLGLQGCQGEWAEGEEAVLKQGGCAELPLKPMQGLFRAVLTAQPP
jgi:hypothetical protein